MKIKQYTLALLLLMGVAASAQELTLEYNFGYGTFKMDRMKEVLSSIHIPLENAKVTDNFPGNYTHQIKVGVLLQRHHVGMAIDLMNTAGQKGVADYSGSYYGSVRLHGTRFGYFYRFSLIDPQQKARFLPYLQLTAGFIGNECKTTDELILFGETIEKQALTLKGLNTFVEPAVGMRVHLIDNFWLNLNVGYQLDLTKDLDLPNGGGDAYAYPDWSGLRVQGGILYTIPLRKAKE
ncbi:hypothetical protein LJC35_06715 [Parabacteroides sp. OttesenSCG-928-N08]|nr:hypothetical protein [Parabacteroides sp. OttesenSCG-928-N08]